MSSRIFAGAACAVALLSAGCKEKPPEPAPAAEARPVENAPPPAVDPPPPVEDTGIEPVMTFAGFSRDASHFAYVSGSATGASLRFLHVIAAGESEPTNHWINADEPLSLAESRTLLAKDGYSRARTRAPAGLALAPNLETTPPTLTLTLDGRSRAVDVGRYPYPPTDHAEVWGLSPDGKMVAIRIAGPAVKSALIANPGPDVVEFYFLRRGRS